MGYQEASIKSFILSWSSSTLDLVLVDVDIADLISSMTFVSTGDVADLLCIPVLRFPRVNAVSLFRCGVCYRLSEIHAFLMLYVSQRFNFHCPVPQVPLLPFR